MIHVVLGVQMLPLVCELLRCLFWDIVDLQGYFYASVSAGELSTVPPAGVHPAVSRVPYSSKLAALVFF